MTGEQKPFGIMPQILAVSDYIDIKKGYCTDCNREAGFSYYVGGKDKDIVVAMNRVIEIGGGFVYAIDGKVVAEIPLKFAGLISTLTAEELTEQFEKVRPIIRDKMKCTIKHPIHTLSYLGDVEIPSLKLSLKGLFNVPGQEFIDLVCRD
jgi:adenine deaminase